MHDAMGSNDRTKIILMFAAVVVLAVGGIVYFFKFHQPKQFIADAQAEIAAWDARWIEARTCLLGKSPGSAKVSEALAIRELSPDPWERKTCTQLISALSRGEATDTRVPAVEEAWRGVDKAASKVAVSFVSHVDPGGDGMRRKPDPLPDALDELEAAYAILRRAAELGPVAPPMDTKPLPPAQIIPVDFGGKKIMALQEPYMTSRAGMLVFGTVDGSEIQAQFAAGKPPVITAVSAGMQRAIPDGSWGARALPDKIELGQLDDKGQLATPSIELALPGPTQVLAVVGTWADGVVVYGAGNQLVFAACKAGTCTPQKPFTVRGMAFATDAATGYTVLAWYEEKAKLQAMHVDPSALELKVDTYGFEQYPKLVCLTKGSAWLQSTFEGGLETVELVKGGTHASVNDDEHALMGCSDGGAALYDNIGEPSYRRCAAGKCEAAMPKAQRSKVPVAVTPTGLVGVEARGGVLAVRKGGPTDFYAVPNGFVPLVTMTDGNVLDTLGWTEAGLVIARASAR